MQIGGTECPVEVKTIAILIVGIAVLIFLACWIFYVLNRDRSDDQVFDDMEGVEFENYCAELLTAKGFENVETTPPSHDYGVDIIADKDGITYAIQCKCYSDAVGVRAVQEAYAGKDYYGCMVAVVMTNQSFTKNAMGFAEKLNVILWDGDYVMGLIHDVAIPDKRSLRNLLTGSQRRTRRDEAEEEYEIARKSSDADQYMGQRI